MNTERNVDANKTMNADDVVKALRETANGKKPIDANDLRNAAAFIESRQSELETQTQIVKRYAASARAIALWLSPFCETSLPYDEMIAETTMVDIIRIIASGLQKSNSATIEEQVDFLNTTTKGIR